MTERNGSGLRNLALLAVGALVGVALLGAARFSAQEPVHHVHYHANWALFIDGQRVDLTGDRYMEDVFQCMADPANQRPEDRVHMHENNHDVVHVHASGVAWGHLLANLGFGIGDDYLETDQGRYTSVPDASLHFVLNGAPVRSIRNLAIGDGDRLLISYGSQDIDEIIREQYPQVATDAGQYNLIPDPASCSGHEEDALGDRLRRAFWM